MTDTDDSTAKQAWEQVGDRMVALGLKLKLHVEETTSLDETRVREAFDKLGAAIRDTVEAVGSTAKDPGVVADLRSAGESLTDALANTFSEVAANLRNVFRRD